MRWPFLEQGVGHALYCRMLWAAGCEQRAGRAWYPPGTRSAASSVTCGHRVSPHRAWLEQ